MSYIERNLKYLEELGASITKLHKTISFPQNARRSPHNEFNNNNRKAATNNSQRDLFKLFNNSIFGKICEQVNNRIKLKLFTGHDRAIKWFSKIHLKHSRCIDGLHLIEMFKQEGSVR